MRDACVYTVQDVAKLLRVSLRTAYNLVRDGDLAAIRVRGQIRISSYALDEFLQKGGGQNEREHPRELVP